MSIFRSVGRKVKAGLAAAVAGLRMLLAPRWVRHMVEYKVRGPDDPVHTQEEVVAVLRSSGDKETIR